MEMSLDRNEDAGAEQLVAALRVNEKLSKEAADMRLQISNLNESLIEKDNQLTEMIRNNDYLQAEIYNLRVQLQAQTNYFLINNDEEDESHDIENDGQIVIHAVESDDFEQRESVRDEFDHENTSDSASNESSRNVISRGQFQNNRSPSLSLSVKYPNDEFGRQRPKFERLQRINEQKKKQFVLPRVDAVGAVDLLEVYQLKSFDYIRGLRVEETYMETIKFLISKIVAQRSWHLVYAKEARSRAVAGAVFLDSCHIDAIKEFCLVIAGLDGADVDLESRAMFTRSLRKKVTDAMQSLRRGRSKTLAESKRCDPDAGTEDSQIPPNFESTIAPQSAIDCQIEEKPLVIGFPVMQSF